MASSPGKWEVVGKGGKTKKNIQGNKKPKTKLNEADLPKLDIKAPIPESKSQFHAFAKSKETPFVIPKDEVESDSDNPDDVSSEVSRQPERRRKHHNKEPKLPLEELVEEALKTCDKTATKTFILETKEKYSNNQLVMLKELTRYLQDYFQSASVEKDPVLGDQQPGFPLCCLGEDIQGLVIGELYECSEDEIDKLFIHCLDEMLIEINKGRATYGIRMIIQSLVKCFPLVAVKDQKEHLIRVESRKNNSREALSLLWVFGQTSDHQDMVDKMAAWTSFMLPVIECKQLSKYVVEYLETTLSFQLPDTVSDPLLPGREFQYVLEMAFGTTYQHFPYRRQLQLLYREIKTVAFAAYPKVPLTGTFSRLFDSLGSDLGEQYTQEALCCLVECLEKDPTCHFKWRNNYLARLKESGLLLKTLVEHWNSVCRSIPGKYLSETLREFQNVNNELKTREKQKAGLSECETSCKTLLNAISINPPPSKSESSRFNRIIKLFLLFLLAAVCVDLYKHSGYQGSKTSRILKRYGVEQALDTTQKHAKIYTERLASWAEKRYPYYYEKVRAVVEPASEYTITKLHEVFIYLVEITAPARAYLHKTVPPLLEKIEKVTSHYFNVISTFLIALWRTYSPVVKHYLQRAWDALEFYVPLLWNRAREITWNTCQWFYNLSPEFFDAIADGFHRLVLEVVTRTPHVLALIQEYLLTAWKLVVSGAAGFLLWFQENVIGGTSKEGMQGPS